MAQLAIGLAGGAATSAFGLPFGLGFAVASYIGGVLLAKPQGIEGPRTTEFPLSGSSYGITIPILYGTQRLAGNLIDFTAIREVAVDEDVGGKGGPSATQRTFQYFQTVALSVCEGEIAGITRIWADKKLIFDGRSTNTTVEKAIANLNFRVYTGSETQEPDSALEEEHGADNTPAYRGLAYIVFYDLPLHEFGNRIPQFEFEITKSITTSFIGEKLDVPEVNSPSVLLDDVGMIWRDPTEPFIYTLAQDTASVLSWAKYTITGEMVQTSGLLSVVADYENVVSDPNDTAIYSYQFNKPVSFNKDTFALIAEGDGSHTYNASRSSPEQGHLQAKYHLPWGKTIVVCNLDNPDTTPIDGSIQCHLATNGAFEMICDAQLSELTGLPSPVPDEPSGHLDFGAIRAQSTIKGDGSIIIPSYYAGGNNEEYLFKFDFNRFAGDRTKGMEISDVFTPITGGSMQFLGYWEEQDQLIIAYLDGTVIYWDCATDTEVDRITVAGLTSWRNRKSFGSWGNAIYGDAPWVVFPAGPDSEDSTAFNLATQETCVFNVSQFTDVYSDVFSGTTPREGVYEPITDRLFATTQKGIVRLRCDAQDPGTTTLRAVLEDISSKVTLPAADYDFTAQTQTVRGFAVTQRAPARSVIESLTPAYFFDVRESDFQIEGVNRGAASSATILDDDLGATSNEGNIPERLISRRLMERELPQFIDVTYFDPARDYQKGDEHAQRFSDTVYSTERTNINLPVVLTADEATTAAARLLYLVWSEREEYTVSVPWDYIALDALDRIVINRGSNQFEARLTDVTLGADLSIEMKGVSEDSGVYSITAAASDTTGFQNQTIDLSLPARIYPLDAPLLRQVDDHPGIYVGAGAPGDVAFAGALTQFSDDQSTWTDIGSIGQQTAQGSALNALGSVTNWATWDTVNELEVVIINGKPLVSASDAQILAFANLAMLGDELIQFANVTDLGNGRYRLSRLLRGRLGSEQLVGSHAIGDTFVVISAPALRDHQYAASKISATRYFRALAFGSQFSGIQTKSKTLTTRRLYPYAPYYLQRSDDSPSIGDITLTWLRRSRLPGKTLNDSPLFETTEDYEVDVMDGSSVVRTITTTPSANGSVVTAASQQAVYDAADILIDFGSPTPATFTFRVYQKNATLGRGYPGEETL